MSKSTIRSVIVAILLLVTGKSLHAQADEAWVWGCEEKSGATICQRWNIYAGDKLQAVFGCSGAMGPGVLVCRGRTVCDISKQVTVREFHDTCEADDAAAPSEEEDNEEDYEAEPGANADVLTPQELEWLAQIIVEELREAENHAEKLEIVREYYEVMEVQGRLNGLIGGRSARMNQLQLDTMDISNILYWAFTDCARARARLNEKGWLANRSAEHRHRAFAGLVNDLVCTIKSGLANSPVGTSAVQVGAVCVIDDRDDTSANVRASPSGEIINRLKNGRRVTVATVRNDAKGRPWMFVEGEYNGTWREWGYVFGELLDCAPSETARTAKPDVNTVRQLKVECGLNNGDDASVDACSRIIAMGGAIAAEDRAWAHQRRAGSYFVRDEVTAAIADLMEAIRLAPDYADAYFDRGAIHLRAGEFELAIADYNKVLQLDPRHHGAYFDRGRSNLALGEYDRAFDDFNEAVQVDPSDASSYEFRGFLYNRQGDPLRAIADYDQAIAIDPTSVKAYNNRGATHLDIGNIDRAFVDLNAALRLDSEYANSYRHRGRAFMLRKDFVSAMVDFDRAIQIESHYAAAYFDRELAHELQGDFAKALADLKVSADLDSNQLRIEAALQRVRAKVEASPHLDIEEVRRIIEMHRKKLLLEDDPSHRRDILESLLGILEAEEMKEAAMPVLDFIELSKFTGMITVLVKASCDESKQLIRNDVPTVNIPYRRLIDSRRVGAYGRQLYSAYCRKA